MTPGRWLLYAALLYLVAHDFFCDPLPNDDADDEQRD